MGSFWDVGNKTSVGGKGWLLEREGQAGGVEVLGPEAEKERQPLGTERAKCLVSKEGRR